MLEDILARSVRVGLFGRILYNDSLTVRILNERIRFVCRSFPKFDNAVYGLIIIGIHMSEATS